MKIFLMTIMVLMSQTLLAQPWSSNGTCDLTNGVQWNNGGATPCACTWYSVSGVDTTLNCAYGDCGQSDLFECVYDCNGHNGNPTDMVPRTCDASASPICWYQGAGSTAGADFCNGIALPIELSNFWGESTNKGNELFWTTVSEYDNDYFEIKYSSDGITFNTLTTIDGAGTSQNTQNYRFIHGNANIGVSYYMISQVDYNGEYEEFPIISVTNTILGGGLFSDIYPNPTNGALYFNYNGKRINTPINICIVNNVGKTLLNGTIEKFNTSQGISFNLDGVGSGSYTIILKQGDVVEVKKIIVI